MSALPPAPSSTLDVFVIGAIDSTPSGQTRLAAALASRHGAPEALVAKAIADKTLRVGHGLERHQADDLVRQLQAIGAVTTVRPALPTARPTSGLPLPTAPLVPAFPHAPPTVASPLATSPALAARNPFAAPPTVAAAAIHAPLSPPAPPGVATLPSLPTIAGISPFAAASGLAVTGRMTTGFPAAGSSATNRDPFAPPPLSGGTRTNNAIPIRDPGLPETKRTLPTLAANNSFGGPASGATTENSLELDTSSYGETGFRQPSSAERLASSGPQTSDPPGGNPYQVHCDLHGLDFDKRKASACRKCVADRKPRLRDNAAKRAFLGLTFALLVGLVPAAYSAIRLGATEVNGLRAQQQELSQKPGTVEIMRQFDDLDVAVQKARSRAMINTLALWALVSSGAMAIWYKAT